MGSFLVIGYGITVEAHEFFAVSGTLDNELSPHDAVDATNNLFRDQADERGFSGASGAGHLNFFCLASGVIRFPGRL